MKTAVLNVIGCIQKVGYRTRVINFANVLDIKGYIRNLPDNSVEIIAQSSENMLKEFIKQIDIKDELIRVDYIKVTYTNEFEGFKEFHKIVGPNETDERLDSAVDQLKILIKSTDNMNETLKETNKSIQNMNETLKETNKSIQNMNQSIQNMHSDIKEMHSDIKNMNENIQGLRDEVREGNQEINENIKSMHYDLKEEIRKGNETSTSEMRDDIKAIKVHLKIP